MQFIKKDSDKALLIIRLSIGILMLFHGISKITHGTEGVEYLLTKAQLPNFFMYGVYVGEILAPLLIILGWRTRMAATIFAVNCLFIIGLAHPDDLLAISKYGGWKVELAGLYLFSSIALIFSGGGKYAISRKSILD